MINIYILNGPNLNLLGKREPEIYGSDTIVDLEALCDNHAENNDIKITFKQTNSESTLVELIHDSIDNADAIIINAAAFTHTSIAILDALNCFKGYVVEVHISDISKREDFRKFSYVSIRADCVIMGQGLEGYIQAMDKILKKNIQKQSLKVSYGKKE